MITDAKQDFVRMTLRDLHWKVPDFDFKIRLGRSTVLHSMEEYYAEGILPRTFDDGFSTADSDQDWLE